MKAIFHLWVLVQILKNARQLGDFLLVGIHNDETVRYVHFLELTSIHSLVCLHLENFILFLSLYLEDEHKFFIFLSTLVKKGKLVKR